MTGISNQISTVAGSASSASGKVRGEGRKYKPFRREVFGPERKLRTGSKGMNDGATNSQHARDRMQSIYELCVTLERQTKSSKVRVCYGRTTAQGLRASLGYAGCHRNPFALLQTNVTSIWKQQIVQTADVSPHKKCRMKAMGTSKEELASIANDSSPRNVRRELRHRVTDFHNPDKREGALRANATDSLPVLTNRVDSRMEEAVRTEENCRLFETLITGKLNAIETCDNLQQQIADHFRAAIVHLEEQKENLIELKLLIETGNLSDNKIVVIVRKHFAYFKKTGLSGIGGRALPNPLSTHTKTTPVMDPDKQVAFYSHAQKHLDEVKARLAINIEQLKGTKEFIIDRKSHPTPERKAMQLHNLGLRQSAEPKAAPIKIIPMLKRLLSVT